VSRTAPSTAPRGTGTETTRVSYGPNASRSRRAITCASRPRVSCRGGAPAASAVTVTSARIVSPAGAAVGASSAVRTAAARAGRSMRCTVEPTGSRATHSGSSSRPSVTTWTGRPVASAHSTTGRIRDPTSVGRSGIGAVRSESPKRRSASAWPSRRESTTARAARQAASSSSASQLTETSSATTGRGATARRSGASSSAATTTVTATQRRSGSTIAPRGTSPR